MNRRTSFLVISIVMLLFLTLGSCSRVDQSETQKSAKANPASKNSSQKKDNVQSDKSDSGIRIFRPVAPQKIKANSNPKKVAPKEAKLNGGPQPNIQVDKRKYDFGRINERRLVSTSFEISNTGDADLNIRRVKSSCGCTATLLSTNKLSPGESTKLKVTFNPRGRKGIVHKSITVYSNDPDEPKLKLGISGQIEVYIAILPVERVFFASLVEGEQWKSKEIKLLALKGEKFQIKEIVSSSEHIKTEVTPIFENERNGFKVKITLTPELRPGIFRGKITIKTDHPQAPRLIVPISAVVRGRVSAVPHILSFGIVPKGQKRVRFITITKVGEPSLKIEKIETTAKFLEAEIYQVVEEGKRYRIKVIFSADYSAGQQSGKIKIHTNEPSQPVLVVASYGYVRRQQRTTSTMWKMGRGRNEKVRK